MSTSRASRVGDAAHTIRRLAARASSGLRMLPAFVVVGTKRGGSTALFEYLLSHPLVLRGNVRKGSRYFDMHYDRGWSWFRSTFPLALPGRDGVITGEASPYYMFHPLAPERLAAALPEARLLAVLRDPVDRAWSHWQYERRRGHEDLPFEEAIAREPERLAGQAERIIAGGASFAHRHYSYLARSRYAEQLERLYQLFPPTQVLGLHSESLLADPNAALAPVWSFLGLPPHPIAHPRTFKVGGYADGMPPATRARLEAYFAPWNERLYQLPGITFRFVSPTANASAPPGPSGCHAGA